MNKISICLNILLIIGVLLVGIFYFNKMQEFDALDIYNRQISGDLTEKEKELQSINIKLGVSNSRLLTQEELNKNLVRDKEEINSEFNKFVEKHKLAIISKDKTIASLEQKIKNGNSGVSVTPIDPSGVCNDLSNCVIQYTWSDSIGRFKLFDPNIMEQNNEVFEAKQLFKIYGEIWEQTDGSLQTRRLVLREMFKDENGNYQAIENGQAEILESEFEYHNPPTIKPEWNWKNLFKWRIIGIASLTTFPDSGRFRPGLGLEFFSIDEVGIGISSHTVFDFNDATKIEQRIGLEYRPTIFSTRLNCGIGVSVGTPFANPFNDYSINIDLLFYLND